MISCWELGGETRKKRIERIERKRYWEENIVDD